MQIVCWLSPEKRRTLIKLLIVTNLTAIILFAACLQVTAKGTAQGISIDKKDAPLQTVFREIETQSGYQFFYKVSLEAKFKNVTVQLANVPLQDALDKILKDQDLSYEIVNKTIVVKQRSTAEVKPTDALVF